MPRIIAIVLVGLFAWLGYTKYQSRHHGDAIVGEEQAPLRPDEGSSSMQFKCDGRTYCSEMTSCAEATFFLKHCPDVKMDGDHDGIPCENQWCG